MSELNSLSNRSKILLVIWSLALAVGFFCWGMFCSKMNAQPETITHTYTGNEEISCLSAEMYTNIIYGGDNLCLN
jgi:hypothetical protein